MNAPISHRSPKVVALPSPALTQADDGTLAMAAAGGDPRAAVVFWDRFSPDVRRILRRTLGPESRVEDLLQAVFLRVFRDLDALRDICALRRFVVCVAVRVARSELSRRRWRRLPFRSSEAEGSGSIAGLYRILDRLAPEARLVLTLHYFERMPIGEIASVLAISVATAERRLAQARSRVFALAEHDATLSVCGSELEPVGHSP